MICKTEGIVLKTTRFQDNGLIVTLYTRNGGMIDFLAKGGLSAKSKSKHAYYQLISILDIIYYYKENRELQSLTESALNYPYQTLPLHPVKRMYGMLMAEVFFKSIKERGEPNEPLYDFFKTYLITVDQLPHHFFQVVAHFLLHLTRFLGFFPYNLQIDPNKQIVFLPTEARFEQIDSSIDGSDRYLYLFSVADLKNCIEIDVPHALRKPMLSSIFALYERHIDHFAAINTLRIFESVFNG